MEQTKYDVFISYSRKDYVKDDEVIQNNPITAIQELFNKNDVKYWFDKDGINCGEEFVKEISSAIVNSKMLVFISSKNSNKSEYTCGEILKAKKAKKLIIPFLIDECDFNDKVELLLLPLHHIDYVKQPNTALPDLLRTVNKEKERIRLIEEKQNEAVLKEQIKQEITTEITKFQRINGEQDYLLRSLYSKSKDVGVKTKRCPVCETEMNVDVPYCESCGWSFASLYGVYGVDGKSFHDDKQLRIVRGIWKELIEGKNCKECLKETASILENERKEKEMCAKQFNRLKETSHSLEQEIQAQQERQKAMESELRDTTDKLNSTQKELEETIKLFNVAKDEKLKLEKHLQDKCEQLDYTRKELDDLAKTSDLFADYIADLKETIKNLTERIQEEEEARKIAEEEERKHRGEEERAKVKTFSVGGVSFKMIRVEGGSFLMGASISDSYPNDNELPRHIVTLSSFFIGETPVTQELWETVMGYNPSQFMGEKTLPVENVSWHDCQSFIKKINNLMSDELISLKFRLPTEAEWEYAASIEDEYNRIVYKNPNAIDYLAWYKDNSYKKTHKVKTKLPNKRGLYDMLGNVFEWCLDWYGGYKTENQVNPIGPLEGRHRVGRGGSWNHSSGCCRSYYRNNYDPSYRSNKIGFRLALVNQESE